MPYSGDRDWQHALSYSRSCSLPSKVLFILSYMIMCVPECMCVCRGVYEGQKALDSLKRKSKVVASNHMSVGNWTPGPLHEQQLLVTPDPSFHFSYTLPPPFPWFSLSLGWGGGDIHTPSVAGHSTSFILCTLTVRSLKQGSLKKGVGGGFGDSTCWGLLNHIRIWTLMTQSQSTCSPRSSVGY